jgi:serine/threonine-protein kinase
MSTPLGAGTRIGPYQIVEPIGAGGMGVVYKATDSRLGRDVALKFLSPEFAADSERLARFEREARVLASLNHPNIAVLYGLEESGPASVLAMELVQGQTLAERIANGPIPIEDTLNLARQLAEALEYAHERGVIHRDLKPANVKISSEGILKVLDFGLAKGSVSTQVRTQVRPSSRILPR